MEQEQNYIEDYLDLIYWYHSIKELKRIVLCPPSIHYMMILLEHDNIPFRTIIHTYYVFNHFGEEKSFMCFTYFASFQLMDVRIILEPFRNPLWKAYQI